MWSTKSGWWGSCRCCCRRSQQVKYVWGRSERRSVSLSLAKCREGSEIDIRIKVDHKRSIWHLREYSFSPSPHPHPTPICTSNCPISNISEHMRNENIRNDIQRSLEPVTPSHGLDEQKFPLQLATWLCGGLVLSAQNNCHHDHRVEDKFSFRCWRTLCLYVNRWT